MNNNFFFVVDTNSFISANLIMNSTNALAFDKALRLGTIAISEAVYEEYAEVIHRKKLDKYLRVERRNAALKFLKNNAVFFNPTEIVTVCRDPKDNMFLELALSCCAVCIITGDADLLALNPFFDIKIVNASTFLDEF